MSDALKPPEWLKPANPADLPEIDSRDAICLVLQDLDYQAQLLAIRGLLWRHKQADEQLEDEIKRIGEYARKSSGLRGEHAVDEWVNRLHASVYQDAAHSMAAVGMLAPFVESIFCQSFRGIRQHFFALATSYSHHPRWERSSNNGWDCHFLYHAKGKRRTDLVAGIAQLADAVGLISHLPNDWKPTLRALFAYRNKMFHCGFEWPVNERSSFEKYITKDQWPSGWFAKATSGGSPWVFYLTEVFLDHCLATVDRIIDGIGGYVLERLHA